jgi:hypothetical protein
MAKDKNITIDELVRETILSSMERDLSDVKKKIDNVIYRHEFELLKDKVNKLEKELASVRRR